MRRFAHRYRDQLALPIDIDPGDGMASLHSALAAVQDSADKLYLLIDEYDNFANEVLMGGGTGSRERYEALLYGDGMFKTLFKASRAARPAGDWSGSLSPGSRRWC